MSIGPYDFYENTFRFRGVGDSTVFKDENSARLTNNYAAGFLYVAEALRKKGEFQRAIEIAKKSVAVVPGQWQSYAYLMRLYCDVDSLERAREIARRLPAGTDSNNVWIAIASDYWRDGKNKSRAYRILNDRIAQSSSADKGAFQQLLAFYYQDKEYDSLGNLLNRWMTANPNDTDAQQALAELQRLRSQDTARTGVRVRKVDVPGGKQ